MRLGNLPIPEPAKAVLAEHGYDELYPPQEDAVRAGVLEGKNLVLASPTASGKTLIAEFAILKSVLERDGKALYLTPLRALASEKYQEFQKYTKLTKADGRRLRVAVSSGDYDRADYHLANFDVIVATNEKADSLLRHRAPWISELTIVVADEVHLLTEPDRGPTLEVVLTRLMKLNPRIQFLVLSATIRNADEIAEWTDAEAITTEWRPVPLREGVHYGGEIQYKDGSSRAIPTSTPSPIFDIAMDTIRNGGQALIFTETRRSAVDMCKRASSILRKRLPDSELRALAVIAQKIKATGEYTRLSDLLADHVRGGAAFHHAGLAGAHRAVIEQAFKDGRVKILTATPTLAAGVNLPARTVIISSYERYEPGYGRYPISVLEYKQFCGRAGRPRYDTYGEAVLVAKTEDEQDFLIKNYVAAEPERIWSKLGVEKILRPHVLATIATGYARSEAGLDDFFSRTFCAHQYDARTIRSKLGDILAFLAKESMVNFSAGYIEATDFGRRVSELYIDPMSAVIIRNALYRRAEKISELSLLHLVSRTPDLSPRLYPRRGEDEKLDGFIQEHRAEFMCDIPELYGADLGMMYEEFLGEVKTTMVLMDWINETTEDGILNAHKVEPGDLLRLIDMADWLLYATRDLARLFGHQDLVKPINELRIRVGSGVKRELIPLVRLEGIGRARARALFNAGLKTVEDLRTVTATDLMAIPMIGPKLAKKIREQAGGTIKSEEWETLKQGTSPDEQSLLTDYSDS